MEKNSIVLNQEEVQLIVTGASTLEEVMHARELKAAEKAAANESYRQYLAERQDRMKRAVETGKEKGISNIGLKYEDLLVSGFDARKECSSYVNRDVVPIKGQFEWFSEAGVYYDANKDDFFYVSSKKIKGVWIQRIYPLTQKGYDKAIELASK